MQACLHDSLKGRRDRGKSCLYATSNTRSKMELAEPISTLRRVNGLSARQLGALVDVAPMTATRIATGAVSPSFEPV